LFTSSEPLAGSGQRELVARGAETRDGADRDVGEVRAVAEIFAGGDVRQMQLDERNLHREKGVPKRDAGMRERGGVDQNECDGTLRSRVDRADQLVLRVALEGLELMAGRRRLLAQRCYDLVEAGAAVNARLAAAEQAQIRPV